MPPERAGGEIESLDERCDVFGLGAILCVILTGKPPYVGPDTSDIHYQARKGKLDDAHARLDACGTDAELLALCKRCLAPAKEDRPRHAGAIADAVTAYLESVQQRLKQAEIASAEAKAKASEARKRQKIILALAASLLLMTLGISGAALWYQRDRAALAAAQMQRLADKQQRHIRRVSQIAAIVDNAQAIHDSLNRDLKEEGGVFKLLTQRAEAMASPD